MQGQVKKQLSENEYEKFGPLFLCSDTNALASKLSSILRILLPKRKKEKAEEIANIVSNLLLIHIRNIQIDIDFYESHEAHGYERGKQINAERIRLENDFDKILRYFEQIKKRCDSHKQKTDKINCSIDSTIDNRPEYPIYPPPEFLTQEDINTLEKFLHWKTFLSSNDHEDSNIGNPYLYINLTSKVGAGGLDLVAQRNNNILIKELLPILYTTDLSVKKIAIIIWSHQYFISNFYYTNHSQHTKNFFIPSLTSLVKDVRKILKNKT